MKRESGLVTLAIALLALFSLATLRGAPAAPQITKPNFARVKAVSPFEIDLTWRGGSNNADGFQIERSTDRTNFRQIAQVLPGTTTYRDKNLFPDTRYFYRIRSFNASGSSRYDTASARTQTPVVPLSIVQWGAFVAGNSPTNSDLVAVSAGAYHSLALRADGNVIGWGDNYYGEATPPTNLTDVIAIAAGEFHSLALKSDGTVVGWGGNGFGQATPPSDLNDVVALAAGPYHSLALKGDGTVLGWGDTNMGAATPPDGLSGVVAISTTPYYSLALKSDGTVVAWGMDLTGTLDVPTNLNSVVAIAADSGLAVAVKNDGTVVTWGDQTYLSTSATSNLTDVVDVGLGEFEGIALKKDGALFRWAWGPSFGPPDVTNNILSISVRDAHFLALSTAPAAPCNPFVTVLSANQLRLSWRDSSSDEKSFAIERYSYSDDTGIVTPWAQIGTVSANTTNFTDTTVQTGVVYVYRIRAVGKFGSSPYSTQINAELSPLQTPDFLSATLGDTNQVNLSWYDSFSGIDSFRIERALNVNGPWTEIALDTVSNFFQNTFTDTTAQPNNIYWYRVRAANVLGFSDYSDPVSIDVAPPAAPGDFYGNTFADSIQFYWYLGATARGTKIERSPDVNGAPGAWTQIAMIDATNGTSYTDHGLTLGTTYWYRARSYNWVGDSDYAGPIHLTIVGPAAPNSLYANVGSTNGVDLTWNPAINDEDGFKVERAPDVSGAPGAWTEIATINDPHAYSESYHDATVLANNTYWYRVRSFNLFGLSDYSTPVSISLLPPPAPVLFSATSFAGTVNLQWQDNTPNLLDFRIERAPDVAGTPGVWTEIGLIAGGNSGYNDADVTPGAVYWYRVRAENWIGTSPYSGIAAVTILPPATPTISSLTLDSSNGVDLTISDPAGDETGFLVERAVPTDLGFINWTQIAKFDSVFYLNSYYFTDTNATPNATNYYRVRAYNSVGTSDYSEVSSIAVVPPGQSFIVGNTISGGISLQWYYYAFQNGPTLGYRLQRAPDAGGQPGAWTQIAVLDGDTTSYSDTNLTVGVTYWYQVQAFNWVGDAVFSVPVSIALTPTSPPTQPFIQLVAISTTNHQADVYWYDNGSDEEGVAIERAHDTNGAPGVWSQIGTQYATNSYYGVFSDTNAVAYTTNWYRVRAFHGAVFSDYSAPVDLEIAPSSPPNFSAAPFGTQITLSWYDSAEGFDGVVGYKLERAPDVNGSPGAWTQLIDTTNSEYIDKNLAADTTYWYRIRSYNWVGVGDYTDPISATITPPAQPSNLFALLGTATNTVYLQWNDFDRDEDGFKIERAGDAGGYPDDNWQIIGTVNAIHVDQATFLDTNAVPYTTNWYRVRAFNAAGVSVDDGDAEARVMPPDAPYDFSATATKNAVQISWFEDLGFYGGFVVQRAPDSSGAPGAWTDLAAMNDEQMTYNDASLPTGAIYWYRLRSFNWVGASDYTTPASVTVPGLVPPAQPGAPNCTVGFVTNQVFLIWNDYAADEDGFKIQRAPDTNGAPGTWTEIGTIYATNSYSIGFTDTNASANSTNWYRVQAFNSAGGSPFSDSNSVALIPPVAAPFAMQAVPASANQIGLDWQANYDFIQGYNVERAPDNGGAPGAWTLLANLPTRSTYVTYNDIAVAVNQKYWYRVQSYNWAGDSPFTDPVLVVDAPPPAPMLTVTNNQPHQFTVNWAITNPDITVIKIERAPDNNGVLGAWTEIAEPPAYCGLIPTNYVDIGIPTGQTFWYRVRAVNAVGNSPFSNVASATDSASAASNSGIPAQPQILSLTQTNGGMLIEWSSTAGNTDVVQASSNFMGGYINISPAMVISGTGDLVTNYFDAGALTNSPARYYRIQSSR